MIERQNFTRELISEIVDTINQQQPKSIIYCTPEAIPALDALAGLDCHVVHVVQAAQLEGLAHFELGVVFDFLEHITFSEGIQFLGRLRNLNCDKIWVSAVTNDAWDFTAMIGLGFKRENCYTSGSNEICTYTYDIGTYNHQREWNTPKYWANPQNWGKYRW